MATVPGDVPATPTIVEAATEIERKRRVGIRNLVLLVLLVQVLLVAIVLALGAGAFNKIGGLFEEVEAQNEAQLIAIDEARLIAAQNAERQDRILLAIGERLVPKGEVRKLDSQVRRLRAEAAKLRRTVAELNRFLRRSGIGGPLAAAPSSSRRGGGADSQEPGRARSRSTGPGKSCEKPPPSQGNSKHCGR